MYEHVCQRCFTHLVPPDLTVLVWERWVITDLTAYCKDTGNFETINRRQGPAGSSAERKFPILVRGRCLTYRLAILAKTVLQIASQATSP